MTRPEANSIKIWLWLIGILVGLLNALGLIMLQDLKSNIKDNRQEFYSKIDRVVMLYNENHSRMLSNIDNLCKKVGENSERLKAVETLQHLPFAERKELLKKR